MLKQHNFHVSAGVDLSKAKVHKFSSMKVSAFSPSAHINASRLDFAIGRQTFPYSADDDDKYYLMSFFLQNNIVTGLNKVVLFDISIRIVIFLVPCST